MYSNNHKRRFLSCFALFFLIMGVFSLCSINKNTILTKINSKEAAVFTPNEEKVNKASILAVGDIMVYNSQLTAQYNPSNATYNFDNNFQHVKKYIENADYSIANLETTLSGNKIYRYSSYPKVNSPDELADSLKYAGFDLISTANNHAYDKGDLSIKNTLSTLKSKNLDVIGTRENNDDKFIIKKINDINIGITSYTYGKSINGNKYLGKTKVSEKNKYNINIFDSTSVDNAFDNINSTLEKMKDTDLQVVYLHWGDKYSLKENTFQKELAQKLCDAGVDVILGSHPHVIQPVKTITSMDGNNETIVAYSLGNFLSNQTRDYFSEYTEDGLMLNIEISKNSSDKDAKITKVNCIPTWLNKYYDNKTYKYIYEIIPIANKSDLEKINNLSQDNLKKSYSNTASQIETSELIDIIKNPFD